MTHKTCVFFRRFIHETWRVIICTANKIDKTLIINIFKAGEKGWMMEGIERNDNKN